MSRKAKRLARARDFIRDAYLDPITLSDISRAANLSPYHFLRAYKEVFQETPHDFVTRLRIDRAKTLLAKGSHNVTEACFEVGFSSLGSFSMLFSRQVGLPPSEYQKYARSSLLVKTPVRSIYVPTCFFSMLYG